MNPTINGAVYFSDPETRLKLGGKEEKIPVFTYRQTGALIKYILKGKNEISDKEMQKIFELLK